MTDVHPDRRKWRKPKLTQAERSAMQPLWDELAENHAKHKQLSEAMRANEQRSRDVFMRLWALGRSSSPNCDSQTQSRISNCASGRG
jgi:hypothetical protein